MENSFFQLNAQILFYVAPNFFVDKACFILFQSVHAVLFHYKITLTVK